MQDVDNLRLVSVRLEAEAEVLGHLGQLALLVGDDHDRRRRVDGDLLFGPVLDLVRLDRLHGDGLGRVVEERVVDDVGPVLHAVENGVGLVYQVDLESNVVGDLVRVPSDGNAVGENKVSFRHRENGRDATHMVTRLIKGLPPFL